MKIPFKRFASKKPNKVDAKKGGRILLDIIKLIEEDSCLLSGEVTSESGKVEQTKGRIDKIYFHVKFLLEWATEMHRCMSSPFVEHAFMFTNVVNLCNSYIEAFADTYDDKPWSDAKSKLEIPSDSRAISWDAARGAGEWHDGFCFLEDVKFLCKEWDTLSAGKKMKAKSEAFCFDVRKLENEEKSSD